MRQNSKGLSHSHSTHTQPGGRQRRSRKRFTAAAQCKKLLGVLPPALFLLLLHLLLFSILLSFPHVVRRLFKMQVTSACVCARVCVESFAAMLASHPRAPHSCRCAIALALAPAGFGTPTLRWLPVARCLVRALALGFGAIAAVAAPAAAAIAACKFLK